MNPPQISIGGDVRQWLENFAVVPSNAINTTRKISADIFYILLILSGFMILRHVFWEGFLGSDDSIYWAESSQWLQHVPYLSATHWGLRHTLVLPMALAHYVLGDGLEALLLPTLLYSLATLLVVAALLRPLGRPAMCAGTVMVAMTPQFVLNSSQAFLDPTECFFLIAAIWLFYQASERPDADRTTLRLLLLSGVSTGLAMVSRETTVLYIAGLGMLFLAGFGPRRWYYFVLGAGFLLVELSNMLFYWLMSGNPFYSFHIAAHHDNDINRWVDQGAGVPPIHPLVDPVVMLLINHNFGLIFSVGLGLLVWLLMASRVPRAMQRLAVLLGVIALVWTLIAAGWWGQLVLIPRYYLLPSLLVSASAGVALALLWQGGRTKLAWSLGGLLLMADLGGAAIDNRNYMFGENALVAEALSRPDIIHTDPETLRRADLLLKFAGVRDHVTPDLAQSGALVFYNPTRTGAMAQPSADWIVVDKPAAPESIAHLIAGHLLPKGVVSDTTLERLRGHPGVVLYRLP